MNQETEGTRHMTKSRFAVFVWTCLLLAALTPQAWPQARALYQQTQYKGQEIGKLTGDVYYARMDDYVSAFMVTTESNRPKLRAILRHSLNSTTPTMTAYSPGPKSRGVPSQMCAPRTSPI